MKSDNLEIQMLDFQRQKPYWTENLYKDFLLGHLQPRIDKNPEDFNNITVKTIRSNFLISHEKL